MSRHMFTCRGVVLSSCQTSTCPLPRAPLPTLAKACPQAARSLHPAAASLQRQATA